ncbi:MAG: DMT family transporter [Candidatus Contubernalis sp.]|nr:DMT family transporter [Candidatus Contubernalis sp.]
MIKLSDLSITVPLLTFTPLFLLVTSPLILQEFPGPYGLLGILFIVTGSYTLNLKEKTRGFLAPVKALIKEKGAKLMLAVAFLWSISSNFDKMGVQNSSPFFWAIASSTYVSLFLFPLMLVKSQNNLKQLPKRVISVLPVGFFTALTIIFQMSAINLTLVPYVISIKRTSVVMSVIFGHFIFKEKDVKQRLAGSVLMIIGVLLITLFGN